MLASDQVSFSVLVLDHGASTARFPVPREGLFDSSMGNDAQISFADEHSGLEQSDNGKAQSTKHKALDKQDVIKEL